VKDMTFEAFQKNFTHLYYQPFKSAGEKSKIPASLSLIPHLKNGNKPNAALRLKCYVIL
jgi:hypothetical protein